MPVVWRPQMSVGNQLIDNDHRYLICLINTVELSLRVPENRDLVSAAIEQLMQYTADHFAREEAIQLKIQYPKYMAHKQEYQDIMDELARIRTRIEAMAGTSTAGDGSIAAAHPEDVSELVALLRHWIIDHVLKVDVELKPYLARYPDTLS
ncbi:MAG: bacteriohemerythrin [Ectothiorhodospiraceae bacterium]|nr:bacteriohemerythrin [Ectothiorhodospiraceae bacterium]